MPKNKLRSAFNARQYMVSKDFEIFYYSDINFSNVQSHSHDYYEFYLLIEGDISMNINKKKYSLSPGDLLLIPPHIKHHLEVNDANIPYRRFVFWISEDYATKLMKQSVDYAWIFQSAGSKQQYRYHLDQTQFNDIQYQVLSLLEETHQERFGKQAMLENDVNRLVLNINRTIYEKEHPSLESSDTLFNRLVEYITTHISEPLDLDTLSKEFYVSKYYIAHLFKETLGVSLHQYIIKKRLELSKQALLNGEKAAKLYSDYGFNDYSVFFRAFKKEYGLSPKEFQVVYLKDPAIMNEK